MRLTNEEDDRSSSISSHFVLRDGGASDESGGRILNLHFREKDFAVLGEFQLARSIDEHLERASGACRSAGVSRGGDGVKWRNGSYRGWI